MVKGIGLSWITVSSIERSKKFFVDCFGFEVFEYNKEYGWCELALKPTGTTDSTEYVNWLGWTVYEKGVKSSAVQRPSIGLCESRETGLNINNTDLSNTTLNFPGQNAVMTFVVDDIKKQLEILRAHQIVCSEIFEIPYKLKMFIFFDFDNNKMEICQFIK